MTKLVRGLQRAVIGYNEFRSVLWLAKLSYLKIIAEISNRGVLLTAKETA